MTQKWRWTGNAFCKLPGGILKIGDTGRNHQLMRFEPPFQSVTMSEQGMLSELLGEIIQKVEVSEAQWPQGQNIVACGCVCKQWMNATKELEDLLGSLNDLDLSILDIIQCNSSQG